MGWGAGSPAEARVCTWCVREGGWDQFHCGVIPVIPVLDPLLAPESLCCTVAAVCLPTASLQLEKGGKKEKKAIFGIEFASPSAQGVLGWAQGVAHTREVLGARERGCTGDGVQPYGLSVQHFETAHQLQPETSSDKNTQKKSWSLKMQITCDAECPCLCVIAKFLDSISQR